MTINKIDYFGATLIDLTTDTVAAADLLEGKTAHAASGETITGTIPNNGAVDISISEVSEEAFIAKGYHDGSGNVSISADEQAKVIPGNIVKGVTILGVEGSAQTGGGSSDIDKLVDGSITSYEGNVETARIGAFMHCSKLETVDLPLVTSIGNYAFQNCSKLETVNLPQATSIGAAVFYNCSKLETVDLPLVTSIGNYAFYNCSILTTFILHSEKMVTLLNVTAFDKTPIKSGTGCIYVPKSLVDTYKSATNWSAFANQFRAIEDYPDICGE